MLGYGVAYDLREPRLIRRTRLTTKYKFVKPNDRNALDLMNAAAVAVMKELPDLVLAYGNSDEFRYVEYFTNDEDLEQVTGLSIQSLADVCRSVSSFTRTVRCSSDVPGTRVILFVHH